MVFSNSYFLFLVHLPHFSKRQQQVLVALSLLYGIWLLWFVYTDTRYAVVSSHLANPDPPEQRFYIKPPIDINTAKSEELQLLPGIGPVLAKRIIVYRQRYGSFTSLESLQNVKGIGPKTIQKIRYYFKFPIPK